EFNRPWTSAAFREEAPGPAGPWLRQLSPQKQDWLDAIDVRSAAADRPLPDVLARDWEAYRDRFIARYRIDVDSKVQTHVKTAYQGALARAVRWLLGPLTTQPQAVPASAPSPLDQIKAYQRQQARINEMLHEEFPAFGQDVRHGQLREARAETRRLTTELHAGWARQTELMHKDLLECLDDSQRALGPLPDTGGAPTS